MRAKTPLGTKTLFLWLLLTVVVMVLIFILVIFLHPLHWVGRDTNLYSVITAILALFFGTAATIAGAVATIKLANLALTISERQDARDARDFLETRINKSIELFTEITIAISELLVTGFKVKADLFDVTTAKPDVIEYIEGEITNPLKESVISFQASLLHLRASLLSLQKNPFGLKCFNNQLSEKDSLLNYITNEFVSLGYSREEVEVLEEDITGIAHFMSIAQAKLQHHTFAPLLAAVLQTNLADAESVGKGYDHAALRNLIFTGNLIFNRTDPPKGGRGLISVSYGTAMLYDLYHSIPDKDAIRNGLREAYPDLRNYIDNMVIDFEPEQLIGSNFTFALSGFKERKDLIFLTTKEETP
jgi:hypothetical protein